MSDDALLADLRRDEGVKRSAYQDHLGYWTIGVGFLIDERKNAGLYDEEIDFILANRVKKVEADLDRELPWWRGLDVVRARALKNVCYQLGITKLLGFNNGLASLKAKRWDAAAAHFMDSKWAKSDTPERAKRVCEMIRTGRA